MDLTFVDKLASQNNGVKLFLVAVDVFSRFVSFQTIKTKNTKETLHAFQKISQKKTEWNKKAAFAERAIQSLKHIIYRYIEDHVEKCIYKYLSL